MELWDTPDILCSQNLLLPGMHMRSLPSCLQVVPHHHYGDGEKPPVSLLRDTALPKLSPQPARPPPHLRRVCLLETSVSLIEGNFI